MKCYDYVHHSRMGCPSLKDFTSLAARLAEQLEPLQTQLILGIAYAGLLPVTVIACSQLCELFPST
jgi:hypothetical protein